MRALSEAQICLVFYTTGSGSAKNKHKVLKIMQHDEIPAVRLTTKFSMVKKKSPLQAVDIICTYMCVGIQSS